MLKRSVFSRLVCLGFLINIGSAHAQSSMTLYGIMDYTFLGYIKTDQGGVWGNLAGSRWGLKGTEDLGGGLSTVMQLENGFNAANGKLGSNNTLFNRQARFGLNSTTWGTVTFGRQYDASVDMVQAISADNYGSAFTTPGDVDNNDNSLRQSNSVKYVSPSFAGWRVEGTYGFSGLAGHIGQGYSYSGGISYNQGPLGVAASYFQATNPSTATGAARTGWVGSSADSLFDGGSINNAYQSAHTLAIAQIGTQYVWQKLTVGGSYSHSAFRPDGESTYATTEQFNNGKAFVAYQFAPAFMMVAGYAYTAASGDTSAKYNQASLGADYLLSKRTDIYLQAAYQRASGTQRLANGGTQAAKATIGSYGTDGAASQTLLQVDLRHRF
ncbi:porin [Trinickia dinghuensis]|uniref:Porin n=1 Tax=Trinickia dinghuensis TaxID=2291023 RepID=A0A3D8JWG7_9BURK|nr:porin [Trinickia dinghuensis]RDU96721.1 porin [Trinickia dinghuensis]